MASLAAARMAREGIDERVDVCVGDVAALPLPDSSVDLVTSSFSVHHWPDAAAGFTEVHRILRPGGRAIIYDLPDWWGRFETHAPALVEVATAGGFARHRLQSPALARAVRRGPPHRRHGLTLARRQGWGHERQLLGRRRL